MYSHHRTHTESDVSDESILHLANSPLAHDFQALNVSYCRVTDASISEIAKKCKKIISLNLAGIEMLSDDTVKLLVNCSDLKSLDLSDCKGVTDEGLGHLPSKCTLLECLVVNGCSLLTDAVFYQFADWGELKELFMSGV